MTDGDQVAGSHTKSSAKGRSEQKSHPGHFAQRFLGWWCPQTPHSIGQLQVFLEGLPTGSLVLASEHPGSLWGVDLSHLWCQGFLV